MTDPDLATFPFAGPTITSLGALIQKPSLKAKLLGKPPFRFLHDITTSLMSSTGYPPTNLFESDQLNSELVKEKDQKIDFLKKLIAFTQLCVGSEINCSPSKVVSGLEPENTNVLLQKMATAAVAAQNKKIDLNRLLDQFNGKSSAPVVSSQSQGQGQSSQSSQNSNTSQSSAPAPSPAQSQASAPSQASASASNNQIKSKNPSRPVIDLPDTSSDPDYWSVTTTLMSLIISRPKMSEKLLKKPPFRFLHDIVTSCINERQYPLYLFSEQELNSENFKETNDKVAFLSKLINFLSQQTGVDLSFVNPRKITAGQEPEATNIMLQTLARAVASGEPERKNQNSNNSNSTSNNQTKEREETNASNNVNNNNNNNSAVNNPSSNSSAARPAMPKAGQPVMPKLALGEIDKKENDENESGLAGGLGDIVSSVQSNVNPEFPARAARPKTARRAPPKLKSNALDEAQEAKISNDAKAAAASIITDDDKGNDNNTKEDEENEGDNNENEGEKDEFAAKLAGLEAANNNGKNAGKLVRDILNASENKDKEDKDKMKIDPKASNNASLSSLSALNSLRNAIQKLCQSANPLGKIIDYVYDDIDEMNKEMSRWRNQYTTHLKKLESEKAETEAALEPLTLKLSEAEASIVEQQRKLHALKATIMRNDQTIIQLLEQKSAVD